MPLLSQYARKRKLSYFTRELSETAMAQLPCPGKSSGNQQRQQNQTQLDYKHCLSCSTCASSGIAGFPWLRRLARSKYAKVMAAALQGTWKYCSHPTRLRNNTGEPVDLSLRFYYPGECSVVFQCSTLRWVQISGPSPTIHFDAIDFSY